MEEKQNQHFWNGGEREAKEIEAGREARRRSQQRKHRERRRASERVAAEAVGSKGDGGNDVRKRIPQNGGEDAAKRFPTTKQPSGKATCAACSFPSPVPL